MCAIQGGTRGVLAPAEYLDAVFADLWIAGRRADFRHAIYGLARIWARHATRRAGFPALTSWRLRARVCAEIGSSRDPSRPCSQTTYKQARRVLEKLGFAGVAAPAWTPELRAGALNDGTATCAVFALTVPSRQKKQPGPVIGGAPQLKRPLVVQGSKSPIRGRAREAADQVKSKIEKARKERGLSVLPRGGASPLAAVPENRAEALGAAEVLRDRVRVLWSLSAENVRSIARPFFAAGWTALDIEEALNTNPAGGGYGYTTAIAHPAGWARARLSAWLAPDGTVRPSASAVRAAGRAAVRARQEARRAAEAAVAARAVDAAASGHGQRARAALAAASPRAAAAIAQGAPGRRARPGPAVTPAGNQPRSTPRAPLRPRPAPAAPPNRPAPELPAWWTDAVAAAARAAAEQEADEAERARRR